MKSFRPNITAICICLLTSMGVCGEKILKEKIIAGFEQTVSDKDTAASGSSNHFQRVFPGWTATRGVRAKSVSEHTTRGSRSLFLTIPRSPAGIAGKSYRRSGITLKFDKPQDWSGFNSIMFDVYNPVDDRNFISAELIDAAGRKALFPITLMGSSAQNALGRFEDIAGLIDLKQIREFSFNIQPDANPHAYYIDTLRLVQIERTADARRVPPGVYSFQFGASGMEVDQGVIPVMDSPDGEAIVSKNKGKDVVVDCKMLEDFEGKFNLDWKRIKLRHPDYFRTPMISRRRGKNSRASMRVVWPDDKKAGYYVTGLDFKQPVDWSEFDAIAFDRFSNSKKPLKLRVEFHSVDGHHVDGLNSASAGMLEPGEWSTSIIKFNPLRKYIKFDKVTAFFFYIGKDGNRRNFHIDNLRLLKLRHENVSDKILPAPKVKWTLENKGKLEALNSNSPDYGRAAGSILCSDKPVELTVELPDGNYRVFVGAAVLPQIWRKKNVRFSVSTDTDNVSLYPSSRLRVDSAILNAKAVNGTLKIKFSPAENAELGISSVVIYPLESAVNTECDYITKLQKDFWGGNPKILAGMVRKSPERFAKKASFKPTSKQKDQGFVLFDRSVNVWEYFEAVPKADEIINGKKSLKARVVRNGNYPLSVSIHALEDLGLVRARLSEFVGEDGKKLPACSLKLGVVLPYYQNCTSYYELRPRAIFPRPAAIVKRGNSQAFWVTVNNDSKVIPGKYHGSVILSINGEEAKIPVELDMLDVELKRDPRINYSAFIYQSISGLDDPVWRSKVKDMAAHGFTALAPTGIVNFQREGDIFRPKNLEAADQLIKSLQRDGIDGPIINYMPHVFAEMATKWSGKTVPFHGSFMHLPPKFFQAVIAWVKEIEEYGQAHNWPVIYHMLIDEGGNPENIKYVHSFFGKAGIKTSSTSVGRYGIGYKTIPSIAIYIYSKFLQKWTHMAPALHAKGKKLWVNGPMAGQGNPPYEFRMFYGFGSWKKDLDGLTPWNYDRVQGRPSTGCEEGDENQSYYFSLIGPDGPMPAIVYELARMGIEDRRAVYTLEQLADSALQGNDKKRKTLARKAKKLIAELKQSIPNDCLGNSGTAQKWTTRNAETYRDKIIDLIIELR